MASDGSKWSGDWQCSSCKKFGGKPYNNFSFRSTCNNCGCKKPGGAANYNGKAEVAKLRQKITELEKQVAKGQHAGGSTGTPPERTRQ